MESLEIQLPTGESVALEVTPQFLELASRHSGVSPNNLTHDHVKVFFLHALQRALKEVENEQTAA